MTQMSDAMKKAGVIQEGSKKNKKGSKGKKPNSQSPAITDISETLTGTVKFFNLREGYGFITDESGKEHFVHYTQISRGKKFIGMDKGDKVEFQISTNSANRPQAVAVRIVEPVVKEDPNAPGETE